MAKISIPSKSKETLEERICRLIKAHRSNLTSYHVLTIENRQIPEHRYVWEQSFGELPQNWVIHHLNGLKGDNKLVNLKALPRGKHNSHLINQALQVRIRQLEGVLLKL